MMSIYDDYNDNVDDDDNEDDGDDLTMTMMKMIILMKIMIVIPNNFFEDSLCRRGKMSLASKRGRFPFHKSQLDSRTFGMAGPTRLWPRYQSKRFELFELKNK